MADKTNFILQTLKSIVNIKVIIILCTVLYYLNKHIGIDTLKTTTIAIIISLTVISLLSPDAQSGFIFIPIIYLMINGAFAGLLIKLVGMQDNGIYYGIFGSIPIGISFMILGKILMSIGISIHTCK